VEPEVHDEVFDRGLFRSRLLVNLPDVIEQVGHDVEDLAADVAEEAALVRPLESRLCNFVFPCRYRGGKMSQRREY
jgi:hypothetical protein